MSSDRKAKSSENKSGSSLRLTENLGACLLSSLLAAVLLAGIESSAFGLPFNRTVGLFSLFALIIALGAALSLRLFVGQNLPRLGEVMQFRSRRYRLLIAAVLVPAALATTAQLTLGLFAELEERPVVAGVLVASSTVGLFTFCSWAAEKCARFACNRWNPPGLVATLLISSLLFFGLSLAFVLSGEPSGTSAGAGIFGVFKRSELNWFPMLSFLFLLVATMVGGLLLRGKWSKLALLLALVGLVGAYSASHRMELDDAIALERSRGLAQVSLQLHRKWGDADGDGVAAGFAGGDCNDNNPALFPGAIDVPGDGIDQDCSGADLPLPARQEVKAEAEPKEKEAVKLADDLNLLLLTVDTLRSELGYTGKGRAGISEQLDKFAQRSTVYLNGYSLASYTSKSLGPMLIGRYPSETLRTFEHFDRFDKSVPFLAERAQDAGLTTLSVQGYWYFYFKGYGYERGFTHLNHEAAPRVVSVEGDQTSNGDEVADELLKELAKIKDERFFAWAHWVDPHSQYVAHEDFDFGSSSRERYDGEVAFVDAQLGRVFSYLEESGLSEKTAVIITSDHGEAFGEHGMSHHGFEVWEELVRVPLLVYLPGAAPRRISEARSIIDVAPTIAEVLGLDAEGIRGHSLVAEALGAEAQTRPVLVDMPKGPHNQERRAFIIDGMKLITTSGHAIGLYDLSADPEEKNDLRKNQELLRKIEEKAAQLLATLQPLPAK